MPKVHWKQLQSNPFLQGLHPGMMTDDGYVKNKQDRIIGMSRFAEKIELEVVFDKQYLMEWLEQMVFEKLQIADWNSFQSLMSEAWKQYKAAQKDDSDKKVDESSQA